MNFSELRLASFFSGNKLVGIAGLGTICQRGELNRMKKKRRPAGLNLEPLESRIALTASVTSAAHGLTLAPKMIELGVASNHPVAWPKDSAGSTFGSNHVTAASSRGGHGFIGGVAGVKELQQYAPTEVTSRAQLNQPLGQAKADRIAKALGLDKNQCFTEAQYLAFISGQGQNGSGDFQSAKLVDESVAILTNSNANPNIRSVDGKPTRFVLGSYGLTVNTAGMLESPANASAPTRQVNAVIAPGGYISTWAAANGAEASLQMLYKSAYSRQLPYGIAAQHQGGSAELAVYLKGRKSEVTGLSMVPSIWEINFSLIYLLNPKLAANMPAYWAPIPGKVVAALVNSPTGQIPFSEYASYLSYKPRV